LTAGWLERKSPVSVGPSPLLAQISAEVMDDALPGPRALYLRLLLHLPRIADQRARLDSRSVVAEARRLRNQLVELVAGYDELALPPSNRLGVGDLFVAPASDELAKIVHERFHYIGSHRRKSFHFGAFFEERGEPRLVALATVSPLDISTIAAALPQELVPSEAGVLSRVFAFDWTPKNTISHLLSRVAKLARSAWPELRFLITYVNPNLGFDGSSYRAANWFYFGEEVGTRYAYLDGNYITDRALAESTISLPTPRLTYSLMPLRPLWLFAHFLDRRLGRSYAGDFDHVLPRPPP